MGLIRVLICLICPPLAVLDKGCGSFLIVLILTGAGWVPGPIALWDLQQLRRLKATWPAMAGGTSTQLPLCDDYVHCWHQNGYD